MELYLFLAVPILLILNVIVAITEKPYVALTHCCGIIVIASLCLGLGALPIQALLLFVVVHTQIPRRRQAIFVALSLLVTVGAYPLSWWIATNSGYGREYAELRDRYPLESMAERVPPPKPAAHPSTLTALTHQRLERLEKRLEQDRDGMREWMLERLHDETFQRFVQSPGFGSRRMIRPHDTNIANKKTHDVSISTPGSQASIWSAAQIEAMTPVSGDKTLDELHDSSVVDFVNVAGFGYVKGRAEVAGFVPHRFGELPKAAGWRVEAIELVGVLLHDAPVAYVSKNLPRMQELRRAPTRSLDVFEAAGLDALRRGEDLYVRARDNHVRMLGAVRAAAANCIKCHGCERGDLLGAFSYTLVRVAAN